MFLKNLWDRNGVPRNMLNKTVGFHRFPRLGTVLRKIFLTKFRFSEPMLLDPAMGEAQQVCLNTSSERRPFCIENGRFGENGEFLQISLQREKIMRKSGRMGRVYPAGLPKIPVRSEPISNQTCCLIQTRFLLSANPSSALALRLAGPLTANVTATTEFHF